MKHKNYAIILLSLLFAIFIISNISATLTFITPTDSSTIGGTTYMLNVSATAGTNMSNCTWWAKSDNTANSTYTKIAFKSNDSSGANWTNVTFDTRVLEDGVGYSINATCTSEGNVAENVVVSSITVDNNIPNKPSSLDPATNSVITTAQTTTFSATVADENTTGCTYIIARNGATTGNDYISGTATYSGSTCSFTKAFSTQADSGNWYWYITASDGLNSSSSDQIVYQSAIPSSSGSLATAQQSQQKTSESNQYLVYIILGILVISLVAVWIYNKS